MLYASTRACQSGTIYLEKSVGGDGRYNNTLALISFFFFFFNLSISINRKNHSVFDFSPPQGMENSRQHRGNRKENRENSIGGGGSESGVF